MIAADTNVVVRLLVGDDPTRTRRVRELLEAAVADRERCFVSDGVLCEVAWVLTSVYAVPRLDLLQSLQLQL